MLKIGVLIPAEVGRHGELLADARALEAAGAHALWIDEGARDPWMLAATLATVTSRARLGVTAPLRTEVESLGARLRTLDELSRGRAALRGPVEAVGAVHALRPAVERCQVFGDADPDRAAPFGRLVDGLMLASHAPDEDRGRLERARAQAGPARSDAPLECWLRIKLPDSHASWRRALVAYEATGADGLLVPLDPRLVDLLRRGDEEDDRSDLTLSQG
jgi:alkanesulfonate monooxygenase SsuD/methylene tetrahydromethanopterin reductase-like flavin-dependent oxidoreductase (luciferase family)